MIKFLKDAAVSLFRKFGLDIVEYNLKSYDQDSLRIFNLVKNHTMTGLERINAVVNAVKYIETSKIEGALVECGVWKGGSAMAMALALKELGNMNRELYLYDTFAGMSAPTDKDIAYNGEPAQKKFSETSTSSESSRWCAVPVESVRNNVLGTGYPEDKFHFIKGVVEKTIPGTLPGKIALLRLDTDWYESTRHELVHLFPLLSPGGVLIIDDYGHWQGAKKAVDEYLRENDLCMLLNRIDYTGVIGIKSGR
jgi:O-methyltransferase